MGRVWRDAAARWLVHGVICLWPDVLLLPASCPTYDKIPVRSRPARPTRRSPRRPARIPRVSRRGRGCRFSMLRSTRENLVGHGAARRGSLRGVCVFVRRCAKGDTAVSHFSFPPAHGAADALRHRRSFSTDNLTHCERRAAKPPGRDQDEEEEQHPRLRQHVFGPSRVSSPGGRGVHSSLDEDFISASSSPSAP